MPAMQWSSAISRTPDTSAAIDELCEQIARQLSQSPDLLCVFISPHHRANYAAVVPALNERFPGASLFGCSAGGVIGGATEIEQSAALSLTAAYLPDVQIDSWHLGADDLAPGSRHSQRYSELLASDPQRRPQFLLLADPFSFPTEQLLRSLDNGLNGATIVGGLASGGQSPGEIVLFNNHDSYHHGALMLSLSGDITVHSTVAQGCRPIGEPMFVTACEGNKLSSLDGRPTTAVINALFESSSAEDKQLMQHSLFVGLAMRERESEYHQGDFLIRNIMGADADKQSVWVGADLRENQVVQFHVRDAATSALDLEHSLSQLRSNLAHHRAMGALLFSCAGRGRGLYGQADHDSSAYQSQVADIALGGFFCNGEIGAVGDSTFVHAYTSSFATFTSAQPSDD